MRQFTQKEFTRIVKDNGYSFARCNGSHFIYTNEYGNHISVPKNLQCVIAYRLIKENNLRIK